MSGFFGLFNYSAPGKGVSKDTRRKRGFFVFLEVFWRKIWQFFTLSLEFTLIAIPCFIAYLGISMFVMSVGLQHSTTNGLYVIYAAVSMALFLTAFLGAGPASMGRALVLRCYARESHAFIWGDFIDGVKDHIGRSLLIFLIDALVTSVASFNIIFCFAETQTMLPEVFLLASGMLTIIIVLLWLMVHPYLHLLTVTHDMSFGDTYKTAFSLAFVKLVPNLVVTVISAAIFMLFIYLTLTTGIVFVLLFPLLLFSLCGFITHFNAARTMDAYFEEEKEDYDDESIFLD